MQYYSSARLLNFPLACIEKQTVLIIIYNAFYYIDASVLLQSLTKLLARTKRLAVAPPSLPPPPSMLYATYRDGLKTLWL